MPPLGERRRAEEQLAGGVANAGGVTRVGGQVLRPPTPHTRSIHHFLSFLQRAGFDGAPVPIGIAEDGREIISYIPGYVPVLPYPAWAQRDDALTSVAALLRCFHEVSRSFRVGGTWSRKLADPAGGSIVCHNDVCLENVVFRDGVAAALLDFDFAGPGRPAYDLAQFARMCVPLDDDTDATRLGWEAADRPARLKLVADAYGLDEPGRHEFLDILADSMANVGDFMRGGSMLET